MFKLQNVLVVVAVLVLGLGLVSSAPAQTILNDVIYSEDFEDSSIWPTPVSMEGIDDWLIGNGSIGVLSGLGINSSVGAGGDSGFATAGRPLGAALPANEPAVQYRALINLQGFAGRKFQLNWGEEMGEACCAGRHVEFGGTTSQFQWYAGDPENIFPYPAGISRTSWIEVMLHYEKGTGEANRGTMDAYVRNVNQVTGAGIEDFVLIGGVDVSGASSDTHAKAGYLDWDAGLPGFTLRADASGGPGQTLIDNLVVSIVPEPTTLVLFSLGAALLLGRRPGRTRH